jgi:hypothetical protein
MAKSIISKGVEDLKRGVSSTKDAISRSFETKRGVELDKELGFRDQKGEKVLLPRTTQKQRAEIRDMQYLRRGLQNQTEDEAQKRRETRGMKKGGKVESKLMKKEGRGMAKATMQKVASKAVKAHESRMHKAKSGSSVSKRADGAAIRGKTRGRMM